MADIARLEVWRHRLASVAEEMGQALQRSAYSANIKERRDFSCAVFDGEGRLLSQAAHIPVHLGAMPDSVAAARARVGTWRAGDVVALNDPFSGGSHLPDITTVSPVFLAGAAAPAALVATRAHPADVGGAAPGSMPLVTELVAEGLVIPPIRLVRAGRTDEDLLALIAANSRSGAERRGDLAAQLAAQQLGARRLAELGGPAPDFAADAAALLAHSERLARHRLAALGTGTFGAEDQLDDDGFGRGPICLRLVLTLGADGSLHADFTGTDPQVPGGVNAPLAVTRSAVYYVVACLLGDAPLNAGAFAPVRVTAPPGCLLNPRPPAAVAAGNVETSQRIVDVLLRALAPAAAARAPAASAGTMNNLSLGGWDPLAGRAFTYYETQGGGAGAGPEGPGADALQVHMTNTRNTPVEALEIAFPLRVMAYRVRRGSGGGGRHRGGDGLERRLMFLAPARATLLCERHRLAPWGAAGGGEGARGESWLVRDGDWRALEGKTELALRAGDELVLRSPGGGGWGPAPPGLAAAGSEVQDDDERGAPGQHVHQEQAVAEQ